MSKTAEWEALPDNIGIILSRVVKTKAHRCLEGSVDSSVEDGRIFRSTRCRAAYTGGAKEKAPIETATSPNAFRGALCADRRRGGHRRAARPVRDSHVSYGA